MSAQVALQASAPRPGAYVAPPRVQFMLSETLLDIRLLPLVATVLSCAGLAVSTLYSPSRSSRSQHPAHLDALRAQEPAARAIARWKLVKALAAAALLALSVYTELAFAGGKSALVRVALVCPAAYAAVLSTLSALSPPSTDLHLQTRATAILLALLAPYLVRDVWPLLTLTLHPLDVREGAVLWAKLALCAVASVGVPLLQPFEYVPADPANPQAEVNPEQTASLFSRLTFSFVSPLIARASARPVLGAADLPPLADADHNASLVRAAYPQLDAYSGASKGRGLFWGLCAVFRRTLVLQAGIILLHGPFRLLVSIGINRLLRYLETGGADALVRPWVWLLLTALGGGFLPTVTNNYYFYLASAMLVRIQAILTTLLFDHALRARLVAEPAAAAPSAPTSSSSSTTAPTSTPNTPSAPQPTGAPPTADGEAGLAARLADLATADLANVLGGHQFLLVLLDVPLEFALGVGFLYVVLGWSAFVGLAVMFALFPIPAWLSARMAHMQAAKMAATDARVGALTEALSAVRMLKLFACTPLVRAQIADKREAELRIMWKLKLVEAINNIVSFAIPLVHLCVSFAVFTLVQKRELSPSIVFSAMGAFDEIQGKIVMTARMSPALIRAWVSLRRVEKFLNETEVLDSFAASAPPPPAPPPEHAGKIGLAHATFTWSARDAGLGVAGRFQLRIDDVLEFRRGALNLVLGPTGGGKSALILALLGELHYVPHGPDSWCSLPREGGIALAAQETWVMSDTIRNNVVFGADWDEARYRKVLYQCALVQDIGMFEAGDATEVGEKGLTLSGGQKARVTLARAIYSQASTLLLDDVLAALDVHTARWIVDKCLSGDLVRGRTVILVTHNVALVKSLARFVVSLTGDGRIATQGSMSEALAHDPALEAEVEDEKEMIELDEIEETLDTDKLVNVPVNGKLTVAEEVAEGQVSWESWRLFLCAVGGRWPLVFFALAMSGPTLREIGYACQIWWLGVFAQAYARMPAAEVNVPYYLVVYFAITTFVLCCVIYGRMVWAWGTFRASREIHDKLVTAVMGTTFRWLDETPSSRIQARCTQDIQTVDEGFPFNLNACFDIGISMVVYLGGVCVVTPTALLPGIASALAGGFVAQYFVKAQLAVKRELSVAKAPVLAIFSSSISGLVSIRAYGFQDLVRQELMMRTDRYTSASRTFNTLDKWASIRMDAIGTVFVLLVTAYLVYGGATAVTPAKIGFALEMAFGFKRLIFYFIVEINATQVDANSLERVQAYLDAPQEPKATIAGVPPAAWPASGDLKIESLSARYSEDGPDVLKDLSLHVKSGERVGIVGRTGSGKSTLTLALLRAIVNEGSVYYDGVKMSSINLDELRSKVTVIPQVPELLNGTLRHNLDMFGEHDDAVLNSALQAAGLFALQAKLGERGLNLDSQIAAGGANLSIGQRQVIALARAIVRQSKLVILDEATSAIDHETDAHIQESLRTQLGSDVTVLIVAHRLRTIADADKILVLDAGRLIEFGSPRELLAQQGSFFRSLVDESADRDTLHALIK